MKSSRETLVRLRPRSDRLYLGQSRSVLVTGLDGFISAGSDEGFFVHETRLLSRYRWLIDGLTPLPAALSNIEVNSWLGYYIVLPPGVDAGPRDLGSGQIKGITQKTLEMRLSRRVSDGLHEDVDLANFTGQDLSFRLELQLEADFADVVESDGHRRQTGSVRTVWNPESGLGELSFNYTAEHAYDAQGDRGVARIDRGLRVRAQAGDSSPVFENGSLVFSIQLAPRARWHACLSFLPVRDNEESVDEQCPIIGKASTAFDRKRAVFLRESTGFTAPADEDLTASVLQIIDRSKQDLASLRLYDLDRGAKAWTMAAGLPLYVALFGRDTLTASWQAALLGPDMMKGTLPEIADWQGEERNDWRDEQPGKMLHEAHTGPLEVLNFDPRARYYGSVTTSGFFPVVVSELWHWTGDRALVEPLLAPALKAIAWLDRDGDIDGDGFYEYRTRSSQGVKNQGWKDSSDAVVDGEGKQVEPPIASCEEQAFAYAAKLHLAEVLLWFGRAWEAGRLYRQARELRKRFNERFWMEEEGFFAFGLDSKKRQIRSIASNPGHCLATGIVDRPFIQQTADRLMRDDLFSGWGIRTLSSEHPAYNPYSYHRGSVWPVEQGTFALAFMRYGLHDKLHALCRAQFDAASLFDFHRLPELFSGHARNAQQPFPALYPNANWPQAWSSSSVFCLVQSLLGLYPYAPMKTLFLDPHLPEWLPELTLRDLRVGQAKVDLKFFRRKGGSTDYKVLDKTGKLHVVRQASPWSLTADWKERLKGAGLTLIRR